MAFEIINPESFGARPSGWNHGMLGEQGGRILFVAGQIVPVGDFVKQWDGALGRVMEVVRAAGGKPENVGRMVVYLTEIVPVAVRTAGFSLAYSLATTIGGSTPVIVTALIHATGNRAMPGAWLSVAAAVALVATLISGYQMRSETRIALHQPADSTTSTT